MPFELNPANGEWEWQGPAPDNDAVVAPAEADMAPLPEPEQQERTERERETRPWWEQVPGGRYILGLGGMDNLKNDIEYEFKQLSNLETALPRVQSYAIDAITPFAGEPGRDTLKLGRQEGDGKCNQGCAGADRNAVAWARRSHRQRPRQLLHSQRFHPSLGDDRGAAGWRRLPFVVGA